MAKDDLQPVEKARKTGARYFRSTVFRVLATYAFACFIVLQVLDIAVEPLGLPVATIRWVLLAMLVTAPLLVAVVGWRKLSRLRADTLEATPRTADAVVTIGHAELDSAQRQIRFSGEPADVQPKVFDLIEYLIGARDRVVGKDELFDHIWPNVVVSEASLTQSIKRARDLFRRNGFEENVIRTVARKGYQFDGPVEIATVAPADGGSGWSNLALTTLPVALASAVVGYLVWNSTGESRYTPITGDAANSLVVLPLDNLTPDPNFDYFSDGLTETLTDTLTSVSDLRVIAHGSAARVEDSSADYSAIGDQLKVAHIVEGSVQLSNDELRVSARLINAADGRQVWSQIYNRPFEDVFAIQDDVSRAIVDQMSELLSTRLVLTADAAAPPDEAAGAEAYRLFLLGRELRKSASIEDVRNAEEHFRAALEILPNYPAALLELADARRVRATLGDLPREATFAESLALINRALESRPDYAGAYLALGEIQHRHFWNIDEAAASYAEALRLRPGSAAAHAAYSRFLAKIGEFDRSVQEAEVAFDLDPKSARAASSLALRLTRAGRLDAARVVIDAMAGEHPEHADLPWLETNWHIRNGSYQDALAWIAREELDYLRLSLSAIALHRLGREAQAQEALDELIATDSEGAAFQIAEVYAEQRNADEAFAWLERALSHGDPGMVELYSSLNLENLYVDPRFQILAERVGLPATTPGS